MVRFFGLFFVASPSPLEVFLQTLLLESSTPESEHFLDGRKKGPNFCVKIKK